MMANRLKIMLLKLISLEKSGFVQGRNIADGVIIAHEVLYSVRKENIKGMIIKLDIHKVYDNVQ